IRTARSRTSGENLFVVLLIEDPSSQELGPPAIPGRFIPASSPNTRNRQNSNRERDRTSLRQTAPSSKISVVPFRYDLNPRARKVPKFEGRAINLTWAGGVGRCWFRSPRDCRLEDQPDRVIKYQFHMGGLRDRKS